MKKVIVVGLGYVGDTLADFLFYKKDIEVTGFDIDTSKLVNKKYKTTKTPNYKDFDVVFIATPTSFNEKTGDLSTSSVDLVIGEVLKENKNVDIYIKSTCPIGFTRKMSNVYSYSRIYYVPEFLSEQNAKEEIKNPSRIVIGTKDKKDKAVGFYLSMFSKDIPSIITNYNEAEAIKLFSNTYLANRIAFFNELDSYAEINKLNSEDIIKGVSLDPRIGDYYNHPSYGYGGYCLPKDCKSLKKQFKGIPQRVIGASVSSNRIRINHIIKMIRKRLRGFKNPVVGVYLLPNRNSPIDEIIYLLSTYDIGVALFDPTYKEKFYINAVVTHNLEEFKDRCDVIISDHNVDELKDVKEKLYVK